MPSVEDLLSSPVAGHEGQCLVCYSALEYAAIGPCGHNEICGVCYLRLRHLHNDKKCPMCKTTNEQLVVDKTPTKTFEEYPLWGNELGADFVHRDDVGMFFPTYYYAQEIEPLFGYHCTHCDVYDGTTPDVNSYEQQDAPSNKNKKKKPPTPLKALQDHLRNKHRLALCQLCVDFKRDFVALLPRFTPYELKTHLNKGDGTKGHHHPMCEFCAPKRFYDLTQLHQHLQRDHYKCDLCDRQGRPNQYFRDYHSLQHHFDAQHFLCLDPQCLSARFVVFDNEIDLRAHQVHTHGSRGNDTKIQLEFRVRREGFDGSGQDMPRQEDFQYSLDGQAFVPEELLSAAPNEDTSHPLHLERTNELRAQAAQIRETMEQDGVEAFPSLTSAGAASFNVGWTTSGSSRLLAPKQAAQEAFPSLPSTSSTAGRTSAASSKLKSTFSNRQFAAMKSAASAPSAPVPSWGGSTAAPSQPILQSNVQRDNFPSLGGVARNRESDLARENFPSLGGGSSTRYVAAENLARKKAPPSLTSTAHFPPPPSSASSSTAVRTKVLADRKQAPAPTKEALANVLDFPPPCRNDTATIEEMKASMGTARYKQLKKLTKEFAADALAPDAYVDHVASLFGAGYADNDFWSFLPSLLASCPNESSAREAKRYMEELRLNQTGAMTATSFTNASGSTGGWSTKPSVAAATTPAAATSNWSAVSTTASQPVRPVGVSTPALGRSTAPIPIKTAKAWGDGSSSSVLKAKAKPGTVSVAAAQQGPQGGTATKFMAKESKKQAKQAANEPKKSKKKQNDELRALAFGGK